MFVPDWFWWLFGSLSALFTLLPIVLFLNDEKEAATTAFFGWWTAVFLIVLVTVVMTFVVKPILAWFFGLF
jgi:hypothetical protein